jgi:hypothetical protein
MSIRQALLRQPGQATQCKPPVAPVPLLFRPQAPRQPASPPVYRPQPVLIAQPKIANFAVVRNQPAAPPVYLPQQRSAVQTSHQPPAPPVYRPQQMPIAQPKIANSAAVRKQLSAPPVYRPQQTPAVQASRQPPAPPVYRPQAQLASVQRKITLKGVEYDGGDKIKAVVEVMRSDGVTTSAGKVLKNWLSSGSHGPFATSADLRDALEKRSNKGAEINKLGKEREESVATGLGGSVAAVGKYGQDEVVYLDPSSTRTNHRHVKLDVKNDTVYGIVGGAAKANNLEKFASICRDLLVISEAHGKTAQVFCASNTPDSVIETAIGIVGEGNVINTQTNEPWDENKQDIWTGPNTVIPAGGIFEMEL